MKAAAQETIKIILTAEQVKLLQPLIDRMYNDPEPGFILAQVLVLHDMAGLSVGYFNKEQSIALQLAAGTARVGQYPSDKEIQTIREKFA